MVQERGGGRHGLAGLADCCWTRPPWLRGVGLLTCWRPYLGLRPERMMSAWRGVMTMTVLR